MVDAVRRELNAVLADINTLQQPEGAGASTTSGPRPGADQLQIWWARLEQLITDQDALAPDTLRALIEQQPGVSQWPEVTPLRQALERYDYDEALVALATWRDAAARPGPQSACGPLSSA